MPETQFILSLELQGVPTIFNSQNKKKIIAKFCLNFCHFDGKNRYTFANFEKNIRIIVILTKKNREF